MSDESEKEIEAFIKEYKPKYPILISKDGGNKYGVDGYPSGFMLDGNLKVFKEGHPAAFNQGDYETVLKTARLWPDGLPETGPFKAIKAAWETRRYAELSTSLEKLLAQSTLTDSDKQAAQQVQKLLEGVLAGASTDVAELAKGPDYLESQQRLEELAKSFDKLPPSSKAKEVLDSFKKDQKIQKEIAALKKLATFEKQVDLAKKPNDRKKLMPAARALEKDLKGTYAEQKARELVSKLASE